MAHSPVVVPVNSLSLLSRAVRGSVEQDFAETVFPFHNRFSQTEHQVLELGDQPHVIRCSDEPALASPTLHVDAQTVDVAACERRSVLCRRGDHAERNGIGVDQELSAVLPRDCPYRFGPGF